jgi:CBS-domain-containing membrane protein
MKLPNKNIMNENSLNRQHNSTVPLEILVNGVVGLLAQSSMDDSKKKLYIHRLKNLDFEILTDAYAAVSGSVSSSNMKYVVCFFIDMDTYDIGQLFGINQTSVRTAKYRIRRKFGKSDVYRLLF